eukprot:TRINITY_DN37986_c0_g1_i1.p1 TRINITY_DN37986_c0_g1~~TRINITY_DN37986_c0_g1_i1.p1  ORF type:complete len:176 (+),score=36.26 TRINITY_DN37986_c0_g1_i1:165-692(+)
MSKLVSRITGWLRPRSNVGVDKFGNRYFVRTETRDGELKERRWVEYKNEEDPTALPVEWVSWLTGRRKEAPTLEESLELEARRERVRINAAMLQKEEEKRHFRAKTLQQSTDAGDVGPPNLEQFIADLGRNSRVDEKGDDMGKRQGIYKGHDDSRSEEPQGTGDSFVPGTWKPPN